VLNLNVFIKLTVADNSGVDRVKCISSPRSGRQNKIRFGTFSLISTGKGRHKKTFNFKRTCPALILTIRRTIRRVAGYYLRFSDNRVLLFSQPDVTIGNRLRGVITLECINVSAAKIITAARWFV
jgi:ribosomal protein L14